MSDTDIADRVDKVESDVSEVKDAVESIKDAVDTEKEPGDGGGGAIRDLAAELANHEEVAANADDIVRDLRENYLSEKADDGDGMDGEGDDDEEEDDEMEAAAGDGDGGAAETAKSEDGDPNFGKAADGSDSAAVAKEAGTGGVGTMPSYRDAAENEGDL